MIILDTDHLSLLDRASFEGRILEANLLQHYFNDVCTTIISFEEQMRGWLSFAAKANTVEKEINAYKKLNKFLDGFRQYTVLDYTEAAARQFQHLKSLKLRVGTMDLKIAAIALANDALLLSRNLRDFEDIPNLKVEDWTIEQAGENQ